MHIADHTVQEEGKREAEDDAEHAPQGEPDGKGCQHKHEDQDEGHSEDGQLHVIPEGLVDQVVKDLITAIQDLYLAGVFKHKHKAYTVKLTSLYSYTCLTKHLT